MAPRTVEVRASTRKGKKYKARFADDGKTLLFGAARMGDFTKHRDPERKKAYLARHNKNLDRLNIGWVLEPALVMGKIDPARSCQGDAFKRPRS